MVITQQKKRKKTIIMNSENSKTSDPKRPLLNLTDKINLLCICYTSKNIKNNHKNNKFEIYAPRRNDEILDI